MIRASFLAFGKALLFLAVAVWVLTGVVGCRRTEEVAPSLNQAPPKKAKQEEKTCPQPASAGGGDSRLPLLLLPGEYTLALPPPLPRDAGFYIDQDAADSLHNLVMAPEDIENGWGWAWDLFQVMPTELRPTFIDQVASVTPAWAWGRLDPILTNPGWGPDVLNVLYRRLLDLPLSEQLPRLLQLAKNSAHPCHERAQSLLQSYFPEVRPDQYEAYRMRIDAYRAP